MAAHRMRRTTLLPAFAWGMAAAVAAHVWLAEVDVRAEDDEVVDVCVNAEGVMRMIDPEATCAPDERRLRLKEPPEPCPERPKADLEGMQRRVAELESRGDERILSRTAIAPFEVVNEAGITVFKVDAPGPEGSLPATTVISNDIGARVAVIAANDSGGAVTVESGTRRPVADGVSASAVSAMLNAFGQYAGVDILVGSNRRVDLGRAESGRYGLRIYGPNGKMVAGVGESQAGSGLVMVLDAAGNHRARLSRDAATGAGVVAVTNAAGLDVAVLSALGYGGSGLLQLRNQWDVVMVEAGTLDTGIGVVRAGPGAFQHGLGPMLGLPASYIEGKR